MANNMAWTGVLLLAATAAAQLHLAAEKQCGDSTCQPHEYCREIDSICSQCSVICDEKNHNVQARICEQNCQDYLHDIRYLRTNIKSSSEGPSNDQYAQLYSQIQRLQVVSTAAIILSVLFACIVLTIAVIWIKKKNLLPFIFNRDKNLKVSDKARYTGDPISTIRLPMDTKINLPPVPDAVRTNNQVPAVDYGPAHQMSTFKNPAPARPMAVTPSTTKSVTRVPSEDATYAYDNPALMPSPKSEKAVK